MKYLCLAYEEEVKLNALTTSEWEALRLATMAYVDQMRQRGQLVATEPLESVQTATTVRMRDGQLLTTDGPFAETKEQLGGFFLIEAKDLDEAIAIAAEWPSARIGSIEVRPVLDELKPGGRYAPPR